MFKGSYNPPGAQFIMSIDIADKCQTLAGDCRSHKKHVVFKHGPLLAGSSVQMTAWLNRPLSAAGDEVGAGRKR